MRKLVQKKGIVKKKIPTDLNGADRRPYQKWKFDFDTANPFQKGDFKRCKDHIMKQFDVNMTFIK